MTRKRAARVLAVTVLATVALTGCRGDGNDDGHIVVEKLIPSKLSVEEGWALFDRSIESGVTPSTEPITVTFDRTRSIDAIKVYAGGPYLFTVVDSAGEATAFRPVDLGRLRAGWHVITPDAPVVASSLQLRFTATGDTAKIPELEIWGRVAADTTSPRLEVISTAAEPAKAIVEPSKCVRFSVELTRRPELLQRAYLELTATHVVGSFAFERTINGTAAYGGAWLPGSPDQRTFSDEIDPSALRPGLNDVVFCLPADATALPSISDIRIRGQLDRGDELAHTIRRGADEFAVLGDEDATTSVEMNAGEGVVVELERLISPDAIVLTGDTPDGVAVTCVGKDGGEAEVPTKLRSTTTATIVAIDAGARACAGLVVQFGSRTSLTELDVVGSTAGARVDWPRVVVTSAREHFGSVAWVGGYVAKPRTMTTAIRTAIDGVPSELMTGDFGSLVRRDSQDHVWRVPVKATFPDGIVQDEEVVLDADRGSDVVVSNHDGTRSTAAIADAQFGKAGATATGRATRDKDVKIRLGSRVGIDIPAGAVTHPTDITIRHLGEGVTLPPLDAALINVTSPKDHGYEFLPHGQKFRRPVEVILPYDPTLIPEGFSPDDVHAFFFDPSHKHWVKLPRTAIDVGDQVTRSSTTHFTIMINAVLAVPKTPRPLAFDPTALTSIAAASPAANIDLIEPPDVTSTGDAQVGLPIRVPAGRGAHTPTLGLTYSSAADNGWLGVGWDLSLSRIEIDTCAAHQDRDCLSKA